MTIQKPHRNEAVGPPTVLVLDPDPQRRKVLTDWAERRGLAAAAPEDVKGGPDLLAVRRVDAVLLSSS